MKDCKTIKFIGYEIEDHGEHITISQEASGEDYSVSFYRDQVGLLAAQLVAIAGISASRDDFVVNTMEMAIECICDANSSLISEIGKIEELDRSIEKIGLALVSLRNCLEQIKKGA